MRILPASVAVFSLAFLGACSEEVVAPAPQQKSTPDPEWYAEFQDTDARLAFVAEVERWFRQKGLVPDLLQSGAVQVRGGRSGTQEFELDALARACAEGARAEWSKLVDTHFTRVIAMRDALESIRVLNWRDAQAQLRLGLQPESYLPQSGFRMDEVAGAVDLPGLVTLAFVDQPQVAVVVSQSSLETWNQLPVVALGVARSNTRDALQKQLKIEAQDVGELGKLYAITSNSYYGASAALWLQDWPETLGEYGAIVIVPTHEAVFAWPFGDGRVTRVIPALRSLAQKTAEQMGSPLDAGVFWRRPDGQFERIGFEQLHGKLEITPPPDLARLIGELEKR